MLLYTLAFSMHPSVPTSVLGERLHFVMPKVVVVLADTSPGGNEARGRHYWREAILQPAAEPKPKKGAAKSHRSTASAGLIPARAVRNAAIAPSAIKPRAGGHPLVRGS